MTKARQSEAIKQQQAVVRASGEVPQNVDALMDNEQRIGAALERNLQEQGRGHRCAHDVEKGMVYNNLAQPKMRFVASATSEATSRWYVDQDR